MTIRELAECIKQVVEYTGEIVFDANKPDGTMRKLMDVSKLNQMGWQASTRLNDGLSVAYKTFLEVSVK